MCQEVILCHTITFVQSMRDDVVLLVRNNREGDIMSYDEEKIAERIAYCRHGLASAKSLIEGDCNSENLIESINIVKHIIPILRKNAAILHVHESEIKCEVD